MISPKQPLDDDLCVHVFTASASMLSVSLAVVGLLRIVRHLRGAAVLAEAVLLLAALAFVVANATSYIALRTRTQQRRYRIERLADGMFMTGVSLQAVVCIALAVEIT